MDQRMIGLDLAFKGLSARALHDGLITIRECHAGAYSSRTDPPRTDEYQTLMTCGFFSRNGVCDLSVLSLDTSDRNL
jgi:hypothetical protein